MTTKQNLFTKHIDINDKLALDDFIISAWAIYTAYNSEHDFIEFQEYTFNVIQEYYKNNQNKNN